jgi:uncharacterized phage protein gp47/JayE
MDLTQFPPLFSEDVDRIRIRMDADANGTRTPADPAWIDVREGGFYWDVTQIAALENERLWDAMSEAVAAAFPSTAWGAYLDEHGETFALTRNPPIAATGRALFTADDVTLVPQHTQIGALPDEPSGDAMEFETTESASTCTPLATPANVIVSASEDDGALTTGDYIYHVTAYNSFGETKGSADQTGTIVGSTGSCAISWDTVDDAYGYRVYRTQIPNQAGELIADLLDTAVTDDGLVTPSATEPVENTTSGVRLAIRALVPGAAGNLAPNALQSLDSPITGIKSVRNEEATVGGADEETDTDFRNRVLAQYRGQGGGNVADYRRWSLAWGIERVYVEPVWDGPGTVLVVAMLADGSPIASTIMDGLQQYLDPSAGLGHGQAPIGATVTVATSTLVEIDIAATVIHEDGFSLDGTEGGVATRTPIEKELTAYLVSLDPGDTVVYQHILACFFVAGVHEVNDLLVNTAAEDIVLDSMPTPQVPSLGTVTLS